MYLVSAAISHKRTFKTGNLDAGNARVSSCCSSCSVLRSVEVLVVGELSVDDSEYHFRPEMPSADWPRWNRPLAIDAPTARLGVLAVNANNTG
jgi:hypothetical protein